MEFNKNRKLDVEYDSKAFGDLIDPYQWNQNFKKIEEVFNQNIDTMEENLGNVADSTIPSKAIPELGQTEEENSNVREQLLAIVSQLILKSDTEYVKELLKSYIQHDNLTTTATTLPPGEDATVSSSFGKDGELNLSFAIPQGKDGALIPTNTGVFVLNVNDNGHLILAYDAVDEEELPDMYIDENGHLIYEIGGEEDAV